MGVLLRWKVLQTISFLSQNEISVWDQLLLPPELLLDRFTQALFAMC